MTTTNNNSPPPLSILQWNSRSLYRSKLTEFKLKLRFHDPSIVLLSETHWVDDFEVNFSCYDIFRRNRNAYGGGVAILGKNPLSASPFPLPHFQTIEAVAIKLTPPNQPPLIFVSVYIPPGNISLAEIESLLSSIGENGIIGGDFNAHHPLWERIPSGNRCGNSLVHFLSESNNLCLNTPRNIGTRMCPRNPSTISTIDLTFSSSNLAPLIDISPGPWNWNSDHRSIFINLSISLPQSSSKPPSWTFYKNKWPKWNQDLEYLLSSSNLVNISNPADAYDLFSSSLLQVSHIHSKFRKGDENKKKKEKIPHGITPEGRKYIALCNRANTVWLKQGTGISKTHLNYLVAKKKKTLDKNKTQSWDETIERKQLEKVLELLEEDDEDSNTLFSLLFHQRRLRQQTHFSSRNCR